MLKRYKAQAAIASLTWGTLKPPTIPYNSTDYKEQHRHQTSSHTRNTLYSLGVTALHHSTREHTKKGKVKIYATRSATKIIQTSQKRLHPPNLY
jgi:hypothetical protein